MKKKFDRNEYICEPCSYGNHHGKREEWIIHGESRPVTCTCNCHVSSTEVMNFDLRERK